MQLPSENAPTEGVLDELADLVLRLGSRVTDLEDAVPECLTPFVRELIVAEQLLDRVVAQSERLRRLGEAAG